MVYKYFLAYLSTFSVLCFCYKKASVIFISISLFLYKVLRIGEIYTSIIQLFHPIASSVTVF